MMIGKSALIGGGALVLMDVPNNALVYGNPAKFIRKRDDNEKYL